MFFMLSSRTCDIGKTNRFYSHRIHRRKGMYTLLQSGALRQMEYDVMGCRERWDRNKHTAGKLHFFQLSPLCGNISGQSN